MAYRTCNSLAFFDILFPLALQTDAKTLYTTYQIVSGTELTLGVVYPTPFAEATQALKVTELSFITVVPFDCIYENYSYFNTFNASVFGPLGVGLLLGLDFVLESHLIPYYNPQRKIPYLGDCSPKTWRKRK